MEYDHLYENGEMKTNYSFFDLDGTLTRGDTFTGFIRHCLGLTGLMRVLVQSAPAIFLWKTGFRSNTYAKLKMFSAAFRGMRVEDFRSRGVSFAVQIERMARKEILRALHKAVKDGDVVAIVSASIGDWIRPWARRHGVENVLATEVEIDAAGRLTGRFSTPNCQRAEKTARILSRFPELAAERGACHVAAWGDSDGDSGMLALADTPHRL